MKNFKSLYGFGGRCLKIRDVCMDFEPCFKVHNLVSAITLKASYLVKWSISTWSFKWWCQFINWLKLETRPRVPWWILERPICGITWNCFNFCSEFSRHPTSRRVFIMNECVNESLQRNKKWQLVLTLKEIHWLKVKQPKLIHTLWRH